VEGKILNRAAGVDKSDGWTQTDTEQKGVIEVLNAHAEFEVQVD
jgi:hypothetical protein